MCVSTASLYKVVNGSPTEEFKMQKGWQGDPLSPFLFVIVVEGLNWMFQKAKQQALIKDMQIGVDELCVTHLQFADDAEFLSS